MNRQVITGTLLIGGIGYVILTEMRYRRYQRFLREIHQHLSYICKDVVELQDATNEEKAE